MCKNQFAYNLYLFDGSVCGRGEREREREREREGERERETLFILEITIN